MRKINFIITVLLTVYVNAQFKNLKNCVSVPDTIIFMKKNKFGYYSLKKQKILIPAKFDEAKLFQEDEILFYSNDSINKKYSADKYATVRYKGKLYRIDSKGKLAYKIPNMVEPPPGSVDMQYKIVREKGKYGIVDKNNEELVVPKIYDDIQELFSYDKENNLFKVEKNEKYGIIDSKGNVLVDVIYDNIQNPGNIKLQKQGVILIVTKKSIRKVVDLCKNEYK